jgi:Ca-activated chloride channel family protein
MRHLPALRLARGKYLAALPDTPRARLVKWLALLRPFLLVLAVLALARPQLEEREIKVQSLGVDLMVVLDLSSSMLARDLTQASSSNDRLGMAKTVLSEFLAGRPGDRIGLIAFAARPYPASPLTLDHTWLNTTVTRLQVGSIEDGTAIGDAILAAINHLRSGGLEAAQGKRQAIILITDGRDNAGTTQPLTAAAVAKRLGIRVHTIGVGSRGPAVIPVENPLGGTMLRRVDADLDEATLGAIAQVTGGHYFRADDPATLRRVFQTINRMEKQPSEQTVHVALADLFPALLLTVLVLVLTESFLATTLLRRIP